MPELAEILAGVQEKQRVAVRGLTGSARGLLDLVAPARDRPHRALPGRARRGVRRRARRHRVLPRRGRDARVPRAGLAALRPGLAASRDHRAAASRRWRASRQGETRDRARHRARADPARAASRRASRAPCSTSSVGSDVDPHALIERLVFMGYERFPEVEAMGHFARRGGILDIYPVGLADPLRLELDGDTIVSLRRFDAGTQRSLGAARERGRAAALRGGGRAARRRPRSSSGCARRG